MLRGFLVNQVLDKIVAGIGTNGMTIIKINLVLYIVSFSVLIITTM